MSGKSDSILAVNAGGPGWPICKDLRRRPAIRPLKERIPLKDDRQYIIEGLMGVDL